MLSPKVPSLEGQWGGLPDLPTSVTERIRCNLSFSFIASCCSLLLLIIFFFVPSVVFGHPGKTDYQDGHKCLKNCMERDLYYSEYHLHDKDRNAIRVDRKKKPLREPAPEKRSGPEPLRQEVVAVPSLPTSEPQTEERRIASVDQGYSKPVEDGCVLTFNDIILLCVAELLLLVMLFLRRKREKE